MRGASQRFTCGLLHFISPLKTTKCTYILKVILIDKFTPSKRLWRFNNKKIFSYESDAKVTFKQIHSSYHYEWYWLCTYKLFVCNERSCCISFPNEKVIMFLDDFLVLVYIIKIRCFMWYVHLHIVFSFYNASFVSYWVLRNTSFD